MPKAVHCTGVERYFDKDEIIVSKTDLTGKITYCNRVFLRVAGYEEAELMGQPHSIIRHPDMPRAVFKLLWDTLAEGKEIFAYVNNRAINGDNYWVLAHVTPSYDASGAVNGYHSSRRVPERRIIDDIIRPLYADLLAVEQSHDNRKEGLQASFGKLVGLLEEKGVGYDELVFSL
ncbi:MAG: PAS domain-containing protein [Magnetospiraceae bacterium]